MAALSESVGRGAWRVRAGLWWSLAAWLGCGDPLLGVDFRGPALSGIPVDLDVGGPLASPNPQLRLAVFFSPQGPMNSNVDQMIEHLPSALPVALSTSTTLNIFEAPPASLLVPAGMGKAAFGLGRLLVYDDSNRNGRRDPSELIVGIDPPLALLYMPQAIPAGQSLTTGDLPAGFRQVVLPQLCGRLPPPPTSPDTCGVPLGEGCRTDADCGGGYCLRETKFPWPAGYCAIAEPPTNGCRPAQAAYYPAPRYAPIQPGLIGYFLRRCSSDSDCSRKTDRDQGNYICDVGLKACFPRFLSKIPVGSRIEVEPFCPAR